MYNMSTIISDQGFRDRRKLTFYFRADKRVDFRDLTKENFRIFKVREVLASQSLHLTIHQSRIWMSMVAKDGMWAILIHSVTDVETFQIQERNGL